MHFYITYQIKRAFGPKKYEVLMYYWQFLRKSDALCFPTDQMRILHLNKIRHGSDKFHIENYE